MSPVDNIAPPSSPSSDPIVPVEAVPSNEPAMKRRPRVDRKRGMFGVVLGTLNKAKIEDKERNASEAAKKRQFIEHRLQAKLRKEMDSVRRAEEAKKEKTLANKREEELQLQDSIHKHRRRRTQLLANFLLTSCHPRSNGPSLIPNSGDQSPGLKPHPHPVFFLPAILTAAQAELLASARAESAENAEKGWLNFREERTAGIEEIRQLRQRVADEVRKLSERSNSDFPDVIDADVEMPSVNAVAPNTDRTAQANHTVDGNASGEQDMVVDAAAASPDDEEVEY